MSDKVRLAKMVIQVAKNIRAMDFPSRDALDAYLKKHPAADKSKHKVKEEAQESSKEVGKGNEQAPAKTEVPAGWSKATRNQLVKKTEDHEFLIQIKGDGSVSMDVYDAKETVDSKAHLSTHNYGSTQEAATAAKSIDEHHTQRKQKETKPADEKPVEKKDEGKKEEKPVEKAPAKEDDKNPVEKKDDKPVDDKKPVEKAPETDKKPVEDKPAEKAPDEKPVVDEKTTDKKDVVPPVVDDKKPEEKTETAPPFVKKEEGKPAEKKEETTPVPPPAVDEKKPADGTPVIEKPKDEGKPEDTGTNHPAEQKVEEQSTETGKPPADGVENKKTTMKPEEAQKRLDTIVKDKIEYFKNDGGTESHDEMAAYFEKKGTPPEKIEDAIEGAGDDVLKEIALDQMRDEANYNELFEALGEKGTEKPAIDPNAQPPVTDEVKPPEGTEKPAEVKPGETAPPAGTTAPAEPKKETNPSHQKAYKQMSEGGSPLNFLRALGEAKTRDLDPQMKDEKRAADMLDKCKGEAKRSWNADSGRFVKTIPIDVGKMKQLARNMAASITDVNKAVRRSQAMNDMASRPENHGISHHIEQAAKFFDDRARELLKQSHGHLATEAQPNPQQQQPPPAEKPVEDATKPVENTPPSTTPAPETGKPAVDNSGTPPSTGKNTKVSVNANSLSKVTNILSANGLKGTEDEMQELAGFKKTLGQRIPEKDIGQYYVRNEAKLKADFIANMDQSNYASPEAFKAAQERLQKMSTSDFGKVLAAINDDEEGVK